MATLKGVKPRRSRDRHRSRRSPARTPLGASPCISKRLHYACRPVATLSYLAPFYCSFRSNPPAVTEPSFSILVCRSSRSPSRSNLSKPLYILRFGLPPVLLPSPLVVSPFRVPRQFRDLHLPSLHQGVFSPPRALRPSLLFFKLVDFSFSLKLSLTRDANDATILITRYRYLDRTAAFLTRLV